MLKEASPNPISRLSHWISLTVAWSAFHRYIGEPILAADLVTRPSRSIITQSFDSRERLSAIGYLNADGFGVAWYGVVLGLV
jgi:hypothetical protein